MQDLGAAGLTSSAVESAHKGGAGIEIDVAEVSRREQGMGAYEVLLSESQERMLIIVEPEKQVHVNRVFRKYDLHADVIGEVTDTGRLVVRDEERVEVDIPLRLLVDEVPLRYPEVIAPAPAEEVAIETGHVTVEAAFRELIGSPNLGSRRGVFSTYDHQVQNNTVVIPGGDAAVVRIKGTRRAIALSTDGNGRYCHLDPRAGAAIAVAEAGRNVVATGARPAAITDCLNFGNPEKSEVYWQLKESVEGMADACRQLEVPVVSGNVSLYNDTSGVSVWPTPVVGMVGIIDDIDKLTRVAFRSAGDIVVLIGHTGRELGGSEYASTCLGVVAGKPPKLELELERRTWRAVLEMIDDGLLRSAHDVADGGFAIAVAESALLGGIGVRCDRVQAAGLDLAALLFSESQSRFVVSCAPDDVERLESLGRDHHVPTTVLGTVGGDRIQIGSFISEALDAVHGLWEGALHPSRFGA
jgi:phosphoribosylformylglycinamidine synthase